MEERDPTLEDYRLWLWKKGILKYKLWTQQEPIYNSIRELGTEAEVVVILCARQFGKSHLGVLMAIEDCLRFPNTCILIVGPTLKQAREIVTPRLKEICRDAPPDFIRSSKSEGKWLIGTSELVIGGFDINSSSQRGKTVQNIYIEELVDSNPDSYIDSMRSDLGPALTHSKNGRMIFLTTPPKIPSHPFLLETVPQAKLSKAFYCYTIDDNKALSIDQYEACIRRAGGRHTVDFRREYLCEVVRDETTSIVPDFNRKIHVKRDLNRPADGFYCTTIDFGGVRDKTVAIVTVYDFIRNMLLVLRENVFDANTPTSEIIGIVKTYDKEFGISRRYVDAPGQLIVDLNNAGYESSLPRKDDWLAGINAMQVMFSLNQIEVDESCEFLITTLESGQFNRNKTDFERTNALGHCDAAAALMYAIRMAPRENPFTVMSQAYSTKFVVNQPKDPLNEVATALMPKRFGIFK